MNKNVKIHGYSQEEYEELFAEQIHYVSEPSYSESDE